MKEYRYKINGNLYKVTVGDIEENQVQVEVNGTPYKVELEKKATPKIKPVMRTASTTPATPPPAVSRPAPVASIFLPRGDRRSESHSRYQACAVSQELP